MYSGKNCSLLCVWITSSNRHQSSAPSVCSLWTHKAFPINQCRSFKSYIVWHRTITAVWLVASGNRLFSGKCLISYTQEEESDPSSGTASMGKEGMRLKYKTLVLSNWQAVNVQTVIGSAALWSPPIKEKGFYIHNKSLECWSNLSLIFLSPGSQNCHLYATFFKVITCRDMTLSQCFCSLGNHSKAACALLQWEEIKYQIEICLKPFPPAHL